MEKVSKINVFRDLIPSEVVVNQKSLKLEYRFIESSDPESSNKIMIILTDITREKCLAERIKQDDDRKEKIVRIAADKAGFIAFYHHIEEMLDLVASELEKKPSSVDLNLVLRHLHTVKGNSSTYLLREMATMAHDVESSAQNLLESEHQPPTENDLKIVKERTLELKNTLFTCVRDLADIVPSEELLSKENYYQVSDSKLSHLEQFLRKNIKKGAYSAMEDQIIVLKQQPIATLFRKLASFAQKQGRQLSKQIKVELKGVTEEVHYEQFQDLFDNLVHLVRNCIDHGIESPDIRSLRGKPTAGHLTLEARKENGILTIVIGDDGAGMDSDKILQNAVSKGLIDSSTSRSLSETEMYRLIFSPGFSTKGKITSISGRGVGMDAIKKAVDRLNGIIDIQSTPGIGTTFEISIPQKNSFSTPITTKPI
jgi:two-component system chemotaxis sensor kinase CheA